MWTERTNEDAEEARKAQRETVGAPDFLMGVARVKRTQLCTALLHHQPSLGARQLIAGEEQDSRRVPEGVSKGELK